MIGEVVLVAGAGQTTGAKIGQTYGKYVEGVALGRSEMPEDAGGLVSFLTAPNSGHMSRAPALTSSSTAKHLARGDRDDASQRLPEHLHSQSTSSGERDV